MREQRNRWAVSLALAVALFAAGCGNQIAQLNEEALALLQGGDYAAAEAKLMQAVNIEPTNKILLRNLVETYFRQAKWEEAVGVLKKCLTFEGFTNDESFQSMLAEAHLMNGDKAAAFPILNALIADHPDNEYYLFLHGSVSAAPELSITSLTKAIELNPERRESYLALARAHSWKGDADKAREILDQVRSKFGPSEDLMLYEVALHLRENDVELARQALEDAPETMRLNPSARLFEAYLDLAERRVEDARVTFETLAEEPEVADRAKLGAALCLLMEDDPNLAVESCDEVLQADPRDVTALNLRGLGQLKRLQKFLAKRDLEKSLEINPDQPSIRALLDRMTAR